MASDRTILLINDLSSCDFTCSGSSIRVKGSAYAYIQVGTAPVLPANPATIPSSPMEGAILVEKWNDKLRYWRYSCSTGWSIIFDTTVGGSTTDELIKVSANDTVSKYLEDAIVGESGKISVTTLNDGGDEDLQITIGSDVFDKTTDDANDVSFDNTTTGFVATDVQGAIDEMFTVIPATPGIYDVLSVGQVISGASIMDLGASGSLALRDTVNDSPILSFMDSSGTTGFIGSTPLGDMGLFAYNNALFFASSIALILNSSDQSATWAAYGGGTITDTLAFLTGFNASGKMIEVSPSSVGVTDHTLLSNIGTNTHAQIDTHIADTANPHNTTDANLSTSDITTNNSSTSKHGFAPKLSGSSAQFLDGNGNWTTPSGVVNAYVSQDFTGQISVTVTHNFGAYPVVQALDATAVAIPLTVTHTSINEFTVTFSTSTSGTIVATLGSPALSQYISVSNTYTILDTDYIVNATGTTYTVTLPTAVGIDGKIIVIKNSGTGTITVDGHGTETIDGGLTADLTEQYESITVVSTGSNWIVV